MDPAQSRKAIFLRESQMLRRANFRSVKRLALRSFVISRGKFRAGRKIEDYGRQWADERDYRGNAKNANDPSIILFIYEIL